MNEETTENNELTREDFIEDMTQFEQVTAHKILDILEENKHILSVEVLGLISIVRVLINNFGDEFLMDTAVNYLTLQSDNQENEDVEEEE